MKFLEKMAFSPYLSKTLPNGKKYLSNWAFDVSSNVRKLAVWIKIEGSSVPSSGDVKVKLLNDVEGTLTIMNSENFTGDGVTTVFNLSYGWIVENSETVTVNGVVKTQGTDYDIDYENGTVTFYSAPADGDSITVTYSRIPVENIDSFDTPLAEFSNTTFFKKTIVLDVEPLQNVRLYVENNFDVDIDITVKASRVSL